MTGRYDYEATRQAAEAAVEALWTRIGALVWKLLFRTVPMGGRSLRARGGRIRDTQRGLSYLASLMSVMGRRHADGHNRSLDVPGQWLVLKEAGVSAGVTRTIPGP